MTMPPHIVYKLNNVSKGYGGRTVLQIPSLEIHRGQIVAIVGPSGTGKSTLLRLLGLLEPPSGGIVSFCLNRRAVDHSSAEIETRREIAMVFQRPHLLTRSVRANIAYGIKLRGVNDTQNRVNRIIDQLDLRHVVNARPRTLSGGEMQRVALARAIVLEPTVLLLDEPTANLDPQNIQLIESILSQLHAETNTTIVIVTHNIYQARRLAQTVGLIYNHRLVEIASTDQFFNSPKNEYTKAFVGGNLIY